MNTIEEILQLLLRCHATVNTNLNHMYQIGSDTNVIEDTIKQQEVRILKRWALTKDTQSSCSEREYEIIMQNYHQAVLVTWKKICQTNTIYDVLNSYLKILSKQIKNCKVNTDRINAGMVKALERKLFHFLRVKMLIQYQHMFQINEPEINTRKRRCDEVVVIKTGSKDDAEEVRLPKLRKLEWNSNLPENINPFEMTNNPHDSAEIVKRQLNILSKATSTNSNIKVNQFKTAPALIGTGTSHLTLPFAPILMPTDLGQNMQVHMSALDLSTGNREPVCQSLALNAPPVVELNTLQIASGEQTDRNTSPVPITLLLRKLEFGWSLVKKEDHVDEIKSILPAELSLGSEIKSIPPAELRLGSEKIPSALAENTITTLETSRELVSSTNAPKAIMNLSRIEQSAIDVQNGSMQQNEIVNGCSAYPSQQQQLTPQTPFLLQNVNLKPKPTPVVHRKKRSPRKALKNRKRRKQQKHILPKDISTSAPQQLPEVSSTLVIEEDYDRKYCICNQEAYGHMIACDGTDCLMEWFHYSCVGIRVVPEGKWYCPECSE